MKITRATIKKFIKEGFAKDNLYFRSCSSFNGMVDCVDTMSDRGINKAMRDARDEELSGNTMGVVGAWFVGQSRDYFTAYEDEKYIGYEVYNCCGTFLLLTLK